MVTTTAGAFEDTLTTRFMLPGMSSPEQAGYSRVVRFDNECVLIPEASPTRSKMPVVLTKSYSLPLWKKRSNHLSDSDVEDVAASSLQAQSSEDNRVTIKVPIPTFSRRSSRSPPRTRSIPSSPTITKSLHSCLVYRSPSVLATTSTRPLLPVRRPSLPIYHRRQDETTIPLRDCCAECERITEECIKEGEDWKEKFSRGARRRRSASLDYLDTSMAASASSHTRSTDLTRTFNSFSTEVNSGRELTSRFAATAAAFSITVDEVDKRRKSLEYDIEDIDFTRTLSHSDTPPSTPLSPSSMSPFASSSRSSRYMRTKLRDREASSSSTISSVSTSSELLPVPDIGDSRSRLSSSPIEEEDENQLFPLPRRSRSNTPSPSLSPKASPAPSPNGSTSSLPTRIPPYLSSTSSKRISSSWQESIVGSSLSRKVENGSLTAPSTILSPSPSSSHQLKHMRGPIVGLNIPKVATTGERSSTSPVSPKGPRPLQSLVNQNKPSPAISPNFTPNITSDQDQNTTCLSTADTIPMNNATFPSFEAAKLEIAVSRPEVSNSSKVPSSPTTRIALQQKRRTSFTLPFIKAGEAIRDMGADVLKGVSSMSSGSGGVGGV